MHTIMSERGFTAALLRWFGLYGRELPWRGIDDAYGIWVSEVILQQTPGRGQRGRGAAAVAGAGLL